MFISSVSCIARPTYRVVKRFAPHVVKAASDKYKGRALRAIKL
jgi:hypothetical protein